jgi:hypothetical protein
MWRIRSSLGKYDRVGRNQLQRSDFVRERFGEIRGDKPVFVARQIHIRYFDTHAMNRIFLIRKRQGEEICI